jgi:hypothetical protein
MKKTSFKKGMLFCIFLFLFIFNAGALNAQTASSTETSSPMSSGGSFEQKVLTDMFGEYMAVVNPSENNQDLSFWSFYYIDHYGFINETKMSLKEFNEYIRNHRMEIFAIGGDYFPIKTN